MSNKVFRGVTGRQEIRPASAMRDLRPMWRQLYDWTAGKQGATVMLCTLAIITVFLPAVFDLMLALGLLVFWYSFWSFKSLPFKLPIYSKKLDRNDPKPGSNDPGKAAGIYFFGSDINTQEHLWFSNSDMRTHVLIFGSTGSGKTEALISLAYNALIQGSGFIYVDGKGDNALFAKIFAMVRTLGREDDLLLVNYMTGANDIIGPQERVLSNTMNPFAAGSSSMLSQLVVSMMDSGGGAKGGGDGDMWKGRAIAFIEALMRPLVWLRDQGLLLLDAGVIRRYFVLDVLEELLYDRKVVDNAGNVSVMDKGLPLEVRESLESYLSTLPGYQRSEKGKQSGKAYEQHGYITMQLTRIFGSLADVYGHIVRTNLAEVDFKDVVLNRRILVVLLPALEKSPDELSNLGKLIIASLKAMLAAGLGDRVEGDYRDVIETKPTNSKTPYLCVLDEYGYYAVKGFAVVPAQARSLGFSVIFAGQDLPAFEKASQEEAASICANTNIKICMKLEDPKSTWEFFTKTAGEAYVSVAKSYNMNNQTASGLSYRDTMEAQLDKRTRVDLLDLKDQREGEAHVFFKSQIIRAKMFYANPPKVAKIKLNLFLKVKGPSDAAIKQLRQFSSGIFNVELLERGGMDEPLSGLFDLYQSDISKDREALTQALMRTIEGRSTEDAVSFGDQSDNTSIFMRVPVEARLQSTYFDVEISLLQDSILTKEKLYEVVKRLAILEGKSETYAKQASLEVIDQIEYETEYARCLPRFEPNLSARIEAYINKLNAA